MDINRDSKVGKLAKGSHLNNTATIFCAIACTLTCVFAVCLDVDGGLDLWLYVWENVVALIQHIRAD